MVLGKEEMGLGGHCDTQSINPLHSFKSLGHKVQQVPVSMKNSVMRKRNVEIKGIMGWC